jgi:serine/threonine protein kinase
MGEIYKAHDTRLDRTVAIKVLPSLYEHNPDIRSRFEREAKAISRLNHPNICILHDIGQENGTGYLVMEYLEGDTLATRLKKGALSPDELIKYATQIADALDRAHKQGLIHRDLKPANIMLVKDGAKLLDFGLAKLQVKEGVVEGVDGATRTTPLTGEGTIIGTLQYMAPEQLEGKEADNRSDIFAFGTDRKSVV